MMQLKLSIFSISCLTLLTGCIHNEIVEVDSSSSLVAGAQYRVIHSSSPSRNSRPGQVTPNRVVCSEPSPDVSKSVTKSLELALEVAGEGNLGVSSSTAESAIQLAERTTTIQLLRDQMHRACEAYANGAITGTTYTLIMSKNNDAMVTLMLGENASGAFGRTGAFSGGKASGSNIAKFNGAMEKFKDLLKDQTESEAALILSQEKYDDAKKLADSTAEAAKAKPDDEDAEKKAEDAKKELATAQSELNAAKTLKDQLAKNVLKSSEVTLKSAAEITLAKGVGGITGSLSKEVAGSLISMQDNYLKKDFVEDFIATCLVELGNNEISWVRRGISEKATAKEDLKIADPQLVGKFNVMTPFNVIGSNSEILPHKHIAGKTEVNKENLKFQIKTPFDYFLTRLHKAEFVDNLEDKKYAQDAYEDFHAYLTSQRQTYLSKNCAQLLPDVIDKAQLNAYKITSQKYAIQSKQISLAKLESTKESIDSCLKLSGPSKTQCMNIIARTTDPNSELIQIPVVKNIKPIFAMDFIDLLETTLKNCTLLKSEYGDKCLVKDKIYENAKAFYEGVSGKVYAKELLSQWKGFVSTLEYEKNRSDKNDEKIEILISEIETNRLKNQEMINKTKKHINKLKSLIAEVKNDK